MTPDEATYWKGVERETRIRLRKMIGEQLLGKLVQAIPDGASEQTRADFLRAALNQVIRKYYGYPWHQHFDELLAACRQATSERSVEA